MPRRALGRPATQARRHLDAIFLVGRVDLGPARSTMQREGVPIAPRVHRNRGAGGCRRDPTGGLVAPVAKGPPAKAGPKTIDPESQTRGG